MKFNLTKNVDLKVITQNYKKQFPNVFKFYKLSEFYIFGNVGLQLIPLQKNISYGIYYDDFEKLENDLEEINKKDDILDKHKLNNNKNILDLEFIKKLIGKTEEEARKKIESNDSECRILSRDNINYIGDDEIRNDRVNLRISNNKVIEAHIG